MKQNAHPQVSLLSSRADAMECRQPVCNGAVRRKAATPGDEVDHDSLHASLEVDDEEECVNEAELDSGPDDAAQDADTEATGSEPTDDPVRMYLMQMGEIPLLTREQELAIAKRIERTRRRYRHSMLASDYVLQAAVALLEDVRDGRLRLDRTM